MISLATATQSFRSAFKNGAAVEQQVGYYVSGSCKGKNKATQHYKLFCKKPGGEDGASIETWVNNHDEAGDCCKSYCESEETAGKKSDGKGGFIQNPLQSCK